ncbi:phosphoribosylamine--glycine ligase, partial [Crocinitomicaceae bacterium]|nr:phosphoribosylamine--glycine ligase [Crocinitomicaceae bacterium]
PEKYAKGKQIFGLNAVTDSIVFHAGTVSDGPAVTTSGGRVLAVTSYGKDPATALKKSYESVGKIEFDKSYFRSDIGFDVL